MRSAVRVAAVFATLPIAMPLHCQERTQARSMVISKHGIAATSQALASQAAAQILARGGSAIDAAIAANALLGLVEPMSCGIGGDLFVIYWDAKTGHLTGLNASGWAPRGLTIEFLKSHGHFSMPQDGIQSVTVPGCVDGWEKLHKLSAGEAGEICFNPRFTTLKKVSQSPKSSRTPGNRPLRSYGATTPAAVSSCPRTRYPRWARSFATGDWRRLTS